MCIDPAIGGGMNGNKVFFSIITILVTIAMGLGAFAIERINNLYEIKASVREVGQMISDRKEFRQEIRVDIKEMQRDLTDIKVALGISNRKGRREYR